MATPMQRVDELHLLRGMVDRGLVAALWLHFPLIVGVAWFLGNATVILGVGTAMVGGAATWAYFSWPVGTARRALMGVAFVVMVSLLLAATAGGAWQTDIHMYYFAALAVLATYCDRNVILAGAAVTAVHHLVLSFAAPALVFSGNSDLGRVVLHATILVIEAAVLVWLTDYLARLIAGAATSLLAADAARMEIAAAVEKQQAAQRQAAEAIRTTILDLSGQFEASVSGIVAGVASAATELQWTSEAMAATAAETSRQSTAVASASDEANRNVQTVGSAAEQLTTSIAAISQQLTGVSTMIKSSVDQTNLSIAQVGGLTDAADKIGNIVEVIRGIAGQTNLLALNATIEAARAGDAGKGFSVVAGEVKALATQTANATAGIASQVKAIQDATQVSGRLIHAIAETIKGVEETTASIAAVIEEQSAATLEISRSITRAAQGTRDVSGRIESVSAAAHETGAAASEVLAASGQVSRSGEDLRTQVDAFLRHVRSG